MFASGRGGSGVSGLYRIQPDGSNLIRLTAVSGVWDSEPAVSPDGSKVAFIRETPHNSYSNYDVFVISMLGGTEQRLTNDGLRRTLLVWSPDGTRLLSDPNLNGSIEVIRADGSGSTVILPSTTTASYYDATWSPDGKRILFHSLYNQGGQTLANIFTMLPDGTSISAVTHWNGPSMAVQPSWSPDGTRVAYTQFTFSGSAYVSSSHIIHADGTGDVIISTSTTQDEWPFAWSRKGDHLLVRILDRATNVTTVWTMKPDGSARAQIAGADDYDAPVFSPDGTRVLYAGKTSGVYSAAVDGSDVRTIDSDADQAIAWGVHNAAYDPPAPPTCEDDCATERDGCYDWETNYCWCRLEYKICMADCGKKVPGPTKCSGLPK